MSDDVVDKAEIDPPRDEVSSESDAPELTRVLAIPFDYARETKSKSGLVYEAAILAKSNGDGWTRVSPVRSCTVIWKSHLDEISAGRIFECERIASDDEPDMYRACSRTSDTHTLEQLHEMHRWLIALQAMLRDMHSERFAVWDGEEHVSRLSDVVFTLMQNRWTRFLNAPAASKMHHARLHGLASHTFAVMYLTSQCVFSANCAGHNVELDAELVRLAALLHDVGKIAEFEPDGGARRFERDTEGHILRVLRWLSDAWTSSEPSDGYSTRDRRRYQHLRHILASHHGKLGWGSPTEPVTPEAMTLHLADYVDSMMDPVLEAAAAGTGWMEHHRRPMYSADAFAELGTEEGR